MSFGAEMKDAAAGFKAGSDFMHGLDKNELSQGRLDLEKARVNYMKSWGGGANGVTQNVTTPDPATAAGDAARQKYYTSTQSPSTDEDTGAAPTAVPVLPSRPVSPTPKTAGPAYAAGGPVEETPGVDQVDDTPNIPTPPERPAVPAQADPPVMVRGKPQKSTALPVPNQGTSVYHGSIPNTYDAPGGPGDVSRSQPDVPESVLGRALHGGLSFIQNAFGLDKGQDSGLGPKYDPRMGNDIYFADENGNPTAPVPLDPKTGLPIKGAQPGVNYPGAIVNDNSGQTAVSRDPNHGVMMLANHAGAMSNEEFSQIRQIIDPTGQLDDSLANVAAINGMYNFYMSKGNVKAANQAAASMIMTLSKISSQLGAQAQDAIKSGKYPEAAKLLQKAYGYIPDGNHATVEGNNVTLRDADGNVLHQGTFTPQQLFDVATGMKNGQVFWSQLIQQTSRYTGIKPNTLSGEQTGTSPAFQQAMQEVQGGGATAPASSQAVPAGPAPVAPQGGTPPASTGATPATPPVASPAPAQAIPTGPVTQQVTPPGQVPLSQRVGVAPHPGQSNAAFAPDPLSPNYQLPQGEIGPNGERLPMQNPPNPNDPQFRPVPLPANFSQIQSPQERNAVAKQVAAINQQRRAAFQQAQTEYANGRTSRKESGFKPGAVKEDQYSMDKDAIGGAVTGVLSKIATDPATGSKFTPESASAFLGPHLGVISTLAAGLKADNPNNAVLQDPAQAGTIATMLAFNPQNPNKASFRVLGPTAGGDGVVIQTDDRPPRTLSLSRANYENLIGTAQQLRQAYVQQRNAKGEQDKAGAKGWDRVKQGMGPALTLKTGQKAVPDSSPLEGVVRGIARSIADQYKTIPPQPDVGEKGYGPGVEPSPRMPVVNSGNPGQDTLPRSPSLPQPPAQALPARPYSPSDYGAAGVPYRLPVVNPGN